MAVNKRLFAFFAALCIVISTFAGCGTQTTNAPETSDALATFDSAPDTLCDSDTSAASFPDTSAPSDGIIPPQVDGENSTPLMWHVTAKNGGELFLLGSIHVGFADTCLFPDKVYDAFDRCEALAVESDIVEIENDMDASVAALGLMVYKDGSSISAHIDEGTYNAARRMMEDAGYYNVLMDYYQPVLWEELIDNILQEGTAFNSDFGVDLYFINEAKRLGKDVLEIEDYMQTYGNLASLSPKTQEFLLRTALNEDAIATYEEDLSSLYNVWKSGDMDRAKQMLLDEGEDMTADERACYDEYTKVMMTDRNRQMVVRAAEYLRLGKKVFYVVGLAHMLGDDGIVESLARFGYDVELVKY